MGGLASDLPSGDATPLAAGHLGARSPWAEREFPRALLEGMTDAVVACDADGLLVLFNRAAREWHGADLMRLPPEAWPGRYDLYRDDGVTPLTPAEVPLARALRGEQIVDAPMAIAVRGRPVRHVLVNGSPLADASGKRLGAFVVMRDVTELRRADADLRAAKAALEVRVGERTEQLRLQVTTLRAAEEELRLLNRQLRAIGECNEALMRATDEANILDEVCRIVCHRVGYRMAWVAYAEHDEAKTLRPVAVAGEDAGFVAAVRGSWAETDPRGRGPGGTAVRTGRTIAVQDLAAATEFRPWLEDAQARGFRSAIYLPLKDEEGQVFGLLLIYSSEVGSFSPGEVQLLEDLAGDLAFGVTVLRGRARRKEAERSLALLSFALDNVREAVYLADAEGRLRYVNDEACRRLGYARDELLARSVSDIDPDMAATGWAPHWKELAERRALHLERRHRTRDGRAFPVEVSANYFEYEGKGYNLALAHDVSERRKLEEQLRQSQKMEAVGTLAGGVAHDFNNILTGIIGYGNLLLESLEAGSPHRDSIEQILAASDRAAQLTRGLLAFSRKQVLNAKPVDLSEIVRGIERLLRRVIGEDVELSTTLAPGPLVVLADAGQIEQVLMNLATNARDAMPAGGILSLATTAVEVDEVKAAVHDGLRAGSFAQLSVSDTGMGMDAETRQKVFEPFFTTKAHGKGTGLGLSIVYGIVNQHGGAIDVYSEPGRGTSFKILLPRVAAPTEARRDRPAIPLAGGTETILVAEDDAIVRGMIGTVLRGHGYRVLEAVDGADALARWAAHRAEIDLLVLDVVMPKKSGREVLDAIAADSPGVPVLFLSGYTADIIHKKGIFDEGLQFLPKPLGPSDLLTRVRGILDHASRRR